MDVVDADSARRTQFPPIALVDRPLFVGGPFHMLLLQTIECGLYFRHFGIDSRRHNCDFIGKDKILRFTKYLERCIL